MPSNWSIALQSTAESSELSINTVAAARCVLVSACFTAFVFDQPTCLPAVPTCSAYLAAVVIIACVSVACLFCVARHAWLRTLSISVMASPWQPSIISQQQQQRRGRRVLKQFGQLQNQQGLLWQTETICHLHFVVFFLIPSRHARRRKRIFPLLAKSPQSLTFCALSTYLLINILPRVEDQPVRLLNAAFSCLAHYGS